MKEDCKPQSGGIKRILVVSEEELIKAVEEERYEDAAMIKEALDGNIVWHSYGFGKLKSWLKEVEDRSNLD